MICEFSIKNFSLLKFQILLVNCKSWIVIQILDCLNVANMESGKFGVTDEEATSLTLLSKVMGILMT